MHIMTMMSAVDRLIYFVFTQRFRGICSNFIILWMFFFYTNSEEKSFSIELLIYLIRDHDQLKPFRHVNFWQHLAIRPKFAHCVKSKIVTAKSFSLSISLKKITNQWIEYMSKNFKIEFQHKVVEEMFLKEIQ